VKLSDEFNAVFEILCRFPSGADICVSSPLHEVFESSGPASATCTTIEEPFDFPFLGFGFVGDDW
jgi:hypothetical protein